MGKKNKSVPLGRSLIRSKQLNRKHAGNSSLLHTAELDDGQDWNKINFNSITEETDVDSFLSTAELAGTEFTAQKLNIKFIQPSQEGVLSKSERNRLKNLQKENEKLLRIPRRPQWDRSMSAEELAAAERESFLSWRRGLVSLTEEKGLTMTPFEKNLEFWRQLWRVIERSDVVVQILDARNPLLFRCADLEAYVKEVNPSKENILLLNKSDFLTKDQREHWADYFKSVGLKALFFSATGGDMPKIEVSESILGEENEDINFSLNSSLESESLERTIRECERDIEHYSLTDNLETDKSELSEFTSDVESVKSSVKLSQVDSSASLINSAMLLNLEQIIEVFHSFNANRICLPGSPKYVTIGLVGYPNVGKSSTINTLIQEKKVSVSATPGKTKHFQTIPLTEEIMLCDCPGLVFPAFVTTKEEMIVWGILPIDQMRDQVPPMNLILSWIPRHILELTYGISIPVPQEGEDPDRCPTSEEFLNCYGWMRGFMTQRGMPDQPRSSRYVLKDFVNGALLYCQAPVSVRQEEFHKFQVHKVRRLNAPLIRGREGPSKPLMLDVRKSEELDKQFFGLIHGAQHIRGRTNMNRSGLVEALCDGFDGKLPKAKPKRNIREKVRRKYAHLDQ